MTKSKVFLAHKISQHIRVSGQSYVFYSIGVNDFGEPDPTITGTEVDVNGVFHTTNSFVEKSAQDGAVTKTKRQPLILALMTPSLKELVGCKTEINGTTYTVTGVTDLSNMGVVADISLEEADNG